jgi:hypothetical protein
LTLEKLNLERDLSSIKFLEKIMIKQTEKPYRKTTATWIYVENGEEKTAVVGVEYYSLSVKGIKERRAELAEKQKNDPEAIVWVSEALLPRLRALPDVGDADGKPIELTLDWLEDQDIRNLKNLQEVIEADENPKSEKPTSD